MFRIAHVGVFDIANYGDHLFPRVLTHELETRGYDGDIVLFSPYAGDEPFMQDVPVFSLTQMEMMHQKEPFDAIVVGGGEIIHWRRYSQRKPGEAEQTVDYPMDHIWMIPCLMRLKYGVPIFWNACGVPYEFDSSDRGIVRFICSNVSYLSVRNDFSKNALLKCGVPESDIHVVPDTAFLLKNAMGDLAVEETLKSVFPGLEDYVVFHCNPFISEHDLQIAAIALRDLHDRGFQIALLPLAYTHGDDEILGKLKSRLAFDVYLPEVMLSLEETIAVIAGASLYIGVSLHGVVTAAAFDRKYIAFDYHANQKTRALLEQLNRQGYYLTQASELSHTIERALTRWSEGDLNPITTSIGKHFDALFECMSQAGQHAPALGQESLWAEILQRACSDGAQVEGLRDLVSVLNSQKEELLKEYEKLFEKKCAQEEAYQRLVDDIRKKPLRTVWRLKRR